MSKVAIKSNDTGTGTFTIQSPATNTDRTLTLPDETGTLYSSGSAIRLQKGVPAFSAYQSTPQSVTNTPTKIALQVKEYDVTGAFDSTTNYRFQPSVAGYYQINFGVGFASQSFVVYAHIYKNGALYKGGSAPASASGSEVGASLVYLNGSTDYLELYGQSSATQNSAANFAYTYLNGILIAAA